MIVKKYKIYRTIGITVGSIILVAGYVSTQKTSPSEKEGT
jgi:primosomal replication protein N